MAEVPTPQRPGHKGQILMKMRAAGMNPAGPHARQRRRLAARAGGISRWCSAPDGERRRRCAGEGDDEVLSRRLASFGQLLIAPIGSGRDARRLRQPSPRMRRWPVCRTASIRCSRRRSRLPGGSALALVELLEPLSGEDRAGSLVRARGVGSALYAARCERRGPGDRELRLGAAAGACAVSALPRPSITPRSLCRTRYDRRIRRASMRFLDSGQPGGSLFRARLARPAREVGRPSRRNTSPMSTHSRPPESPESTSRSRPRPGSSSGWRTLSFPGGSSRRRSRGSRSRRRRPSLTRRSPVPADGKTVIKL